ncbi:hypothetical protein A3C91_00450 [Candidatus Azambacteria bacterium RIFCSPHIGHO2_02_FULL_52_12]|uniref:Uncharacterized protein n=1 Tax=Candidatus Azambacteria bacterium RIFCSPLOWO2_01_FULL_46_25 TaxID=1797298 RepID=A0A1F5BTM8_9BACT|nr:MAG: hypothetical protein A3C91_00450 [Candidatus Azambacteria bacterium RIFCSPHIGHO2_02_FULL_52_12]OGD33972.1 MAG: hypothetical protein A2988_00600 [Candidatus Azambacteria bacterium RIFCSPLOWO2_01_FULL_46_25]OGD37658.1 MAG: hypothetical protein A2850_04675 [Candidatus Azambacteria bacterium RIFCSPHIGHO2_01_FULL_51_74]
MIIPFATTNFRNSSRVFGIKTADRRNHMYVVGKTGTGKTTLLRNMMISDIMAGNGVAVVDPHGEFAESILDYVPENRIDDVVYFNPADLDFPIAFNAVEKVEANERHLVSSGLISIFKKIWADSWGPRLEYVLRNAILALLEQPDSTLLGVMRILSDKEYRKKVVNNLTDPVVKQFWIEEFGKYSSKFEVEAVAPIQNKVGQFLTNPMIRNIVGQVKSSMRMRDIMDSKKILIMNLSKGRIGEDSSALMGAMLITKIQQAAMSRIDIAEEDGREDFYLYVDEFQNFATESFAGILSEARKYHLDLILAHQYITQLDETVRDAVLGNAGTLITFRIGADDAEFFEKEFAPEIMALDLVNLPNRKIYLKLMIDGVTSKAFSADTMPPIPKPAQSFKEEIIKRCRERYGTHRTDVEGGISTWSMPVEVSRGSYPPAPGGVTDQRFDFPREATPVPNGTFGRASKPEKPLFDAVCSSCGNPTKVPFEPDPKRKVYCKDCLPGIVKAKHEMATYKASAVQAVRAEALRPRKGPDLSGLREALNKSLEIAQANNSKNALKKELQEQNMKMEDITKF